MAEFTLWHHPDCSASGLVLQTLHDAGTTVAVRDCQAQLPSVDALRAALTRMERVPRDLRRRGNTACDDLGPDDPALSHDVLIAAMTAHPASIERPAVPGPRGAWLCRPRRAAADVLGD